MNRKNKLIKWNYYGKNKEGRHILGEEFYNAHLQISTKWAKDLSRWFMKEDVWSISTQNYSAPLVFRANTS